jgi:hypothetical protein
LTKLIADPFVQTGLLAVVGAGITRILLRGYAAWRLMVQLVFFTALTALLHHCDIVPYEVAAGGARKAQLTKLSSPNRSNGVKVRVRLAPSMAPSSILAILRTVLLSSNSIMSMPVPTIEIKSMDAQAIEFDLGFRVQDFSVAATARHEVYDLIYRHARATGLALASPTDAITVTSLQPAGGGGAQPRASTLSLVNAMPLFATLSEQEKQVLATSMMQRTYSKGEVVAEQDIRLNSLFVIRTGVLVVSRKEADTEVELSRLSPGDYFGEAALFAGQWELETVGALTFAAVYEVG